MEGNLEMMWEDRTLFNWKALQFKWKTSKLLLPGAVTAIDFTFTNWIYGWVINASREFPPWPAGIYPPYTRRMGCLAWLKCMPLTYIHGIYTECSELQVIHIQLEPLTTIFIRHAGRGMDLNQFLWLINKRFELIALLSKPPSVQKD